MWKILSLQPMTNSWRITSDNRMPLVFATQVLDQVLQSVTFVTHTNKRSAILGEFDTNSQTFIVAVIAIAAYIIMFF
jgi:hypothetical protein